MSFVNDSNREVFGIAGVSPEILAVGFAKYSRSQDSIKVTLQNITKESSSEFHNKWVLGYGDSSVADMAMVSIAFENVSILASKEIEDARIASFQEKSTRYVPFYSVYLPSGLSEEENVIYKETVELLLKTYKTIKENMIEYYSELYPKPEKMSDFFYNARLQARALDIARYILPTGTVTNFGMIASARTIRYLISKLKVNKLEEVRLIAHEMEKAATEKGYTPIKEEILKKYYSGKGKGLLIKPTNGIPENWIINKEYWEPPSNIPKLNPESNEIIEMIRETAPTLVKHTEPKEYLVKLETIVKEFIKENIIFEKKEKNKTERVEMIIDKSNDPLKEIITTLIYKYSNNRYKEIYQKVENIEKKKLVEFLDKVNKIRGDYDQPDRCFETGTSYIFDTCMDYGAYRDLQRHRICTQISVPLDTTLGFEIPRDITNTNVYNLYLDVITKASNNSRKLGENSRYLIPLGFRKRTLFKMNLRELIHIVNLRTKTGGHFSYRTLCYEMYEKYIKEYPEMKVLFNAVEMDFAADFYKR